MLDGFRILDAAVERLAYQHQGDGDEQAEHGGDEDDQRLLRLDRLGDVDIGGIDDAHVAHRAGAHDVQFLGLVQQLGVDLSADLHVAGQAQQFLLGFRQAFDLLRQAVLLGAEFADLLDQRLVGRVLASELAVHLGLLQLQFGDAGIQRNDLVEDRLGFQADIHRLALGLVGVQGVFGFFQVTAYFRQLAAEELQAGCGFGGGALDVLPHIQLADLVQYLDGASRVVVFQGHGDDAGLLAALADVQVLLVLQDRGHATLADHIELGARVGVQLLDLDGHAVLFVWMAGFALEQGVVLVIQQHEVAVFARYQLEVLFQQRFRHVQLEDFQFLAAPAVAVQAEQWRSDFAGGFRGESTGEEVADQREALGLGNDVQMQVVDRLADDGTGLDQLDFGNRSRLPAEHLAHVGKAGNRRLLLLDLDDGVGAVDRRGQQGIGDAHGHEAGGDTGDQPLVVEQGAEQTKEVDLVVVLVVHGDRGLLLHVSASSCVRLAVRADASGPRIHAFLDQGVGVLEGGAALAVGIGNFAVVLPFAEQEGLAACLRGDLGNALQVAFFHHQDQIGFAQQAGRQLAGTMLVRLFAVLLEGGQGVAFDGLVDQGAEACRADLHVSTSQSLAQQMLCGGAATDVADADDQDPFEHNSSPCAWWVGGDMGQRM
ncbi:hypothetical protein D9M71_249870 [compost metagenome]